MWRPRTSFPGLGLGAGGGIPPHCAAPAPRLITGAQQSQCRLTVPTAHCLPKLKNGHTDCLFNHIFFRRGKAPTMDVQNRGKYRNQSCFAFDWGLFHT